MIDNLKKILNEDQDPKAIEKITAKLENLLMSNEEVGYIAVQKKPAVTIFPDSIVVTNKRIILCKPKNLGLSMEFIDYDWDDVAGSFVKEGILGADFTFTTNSDLTHTVDYLPKNQARKLYTYAKEQLDLLKNPKVATPIVEEVKAEASIETPTQEVVEEIQAEEVTHFAELMPTPNDVIRDTEVEAPISEEKGLAHLTQDELFAKLQNYKKLLDNGLILQGEYDRLKSDILKYL
ncbi:PH domain-containing protein [Flavobacterium proteolyticum]|uniref:PH domain-containing protein n=1 Tax=Flavobacterium proteolyticum TaxID=2911683 RepID=A0ABR9WNI9_9FLAO|nr:PH domain-containing protein [Flavobacterium proteolyticum]MBE9575478.1 PH domain-containing protein [Flavobacterium proteolyticum]